MTQEKVIKIPIKGRLEAYKIAPFRFYSWETSENYFYKSFSLEEAIDLIIKHLKIEVEVIPEKKEPEKIVVHTKE